MVPACNSYANPATAELLPVGGRSAAIGTTTVRGAAIRGTTVGSAAIRSTAIGGRIALGDIEKLEIEYQNRARLDFSARRRIHAVGQIGRNVQAPLAADLHQLQSFCPARDNTAHVERRRLGAMARVA